MEVALTGHLAATPHTNDSASAMTRLTEMGIEPFLPASAVLGVLAQPRARACRHCRQPETPSLAKLGVLGDDDILPDLPDPITVPRLGGATSARHRVLRPARRLQMLLNSEKIESPTVQRAASGGDPPAGAQGRHDHAARGRAAQGDGRREPRSTNSCGPSASALSRRFRGCLAAANPRNPTAPRRRTAGVCRRLGPQWHCPEPPPFCARFSLATRS